MDPTLIDAYRFFRAHAGGWVGHSAETAIRLARAEASAETIGLTVEWRDEEEAWDGEPPAPIYILLGLVHDPDDGRRVLASLGMVGVNDPRDPYLRVVAAELLAEAIDLLASEQADELAARATLAGPPQV